MKQYSLDDLDAVKASAEAQPLPYTNPRGEVTGIVLMVLGSQSETVTKEVARLVNERRHKEASRAALARPTSHTVEYETLESDVEFGQRLAAVRLVGWSGITDPYTPEGALRLCQSNRDVAAQITTYSDNVANFMKS